MKAAGSPDLSTVSCPCGASIGIDLSSGDDVLFCPECRETLQLSVSVDPITKKKRVGVLLSMGALLSKKGKKGETHVPGGGGGEVHKVKCTCGAMVLVDPQKVDSVHTCGKCGAGYSAVLKGGRTPGLSTLVLRPVHAAPVTKVVPAPKPSPRPPVPVQAAPAKLPVPAPVPKPRPAAAPAPRPPAPPAVKAAPVPALKPKPAAAPVIDAASTPAREQVITIHKGDMGAQSIVVREDGSFISCFCGKEIRLKGEASREVHKCPECGMSYRLFYAFDPRTKNPMVVMLPRPPGR